jgi:ABC-type branched-subunit amino acid transport system ATPase component/ABC-type branched-subunit amino acid transport system permease subunit
MTTFLLFMFLGIGTGAIYALGAQGIVLIYRGSGILNFAQGAVALLGANAFVAWRDDLGTPLAAIAGVAVGALTGASIQLLLMRPLRAASSLVRVIATLGVLTVVQQVTLRIWGTNPRFVADVLPTNSVHLAKDLDVPVQSFWLLGIAVAVTAVLWLVYRFTQFGRQTVAVAEDEVNAASLGCSPRMVALVNWMAGCAVAGLAGVFMAQPSNLNPATITLLVVPALAAALVGGFRSFPLTLAGALLLGVLQAELQNYVDAPGWPQAAPFLMIIGLMIVRGEALPLRSHTIDRLPRIGSGRIRLPLLLGSTGVCLLLIWFVDVGFANALVPTLAIALVALSLVVVTGYAGQLSLAQLTIAGVGALFASRMADAWGVPFVAALVLGVLATIPVGLAVALPALRTRGVNLAIATLGLGVTIQSLILSNPDYTGGPIRGTVVGAATFFGWDIDFGTYPRRYATILLFAFVVCGIAVANVRRGRAGRRLLAVRANERAAAAMGVDVVLAKLYAFGLASAIAAVGGIFIAFEFSHVVFDGYDTLGSITVVLYAVIGGIGMVTGPLIGAAAAPGGVGQWLVNHWVTINDWVILIGGLLFLITILVQPEGVARKVVDQLGRFFPAGRDSRDLLKGEGRQRVPAGELDLRGLGARFGSVQALAGVDMTVRAGEVVGLIGPNGAGKTTLVDSVSGVIRGYEGEVWLNGHRIDRWSASKRARHGLSRSFQSVELFEDMTVLDNIRVASDSSSRRVYLADIFWPRTETLSSSAVAAIKEFGLADDLDKYPSELPFGRRHLVGLARAVASSSSIILLDEPCAGLDDEERAEISELIRALAQDWGMGVLLIEHDVELVMRTCDRIVALDAGRPIAAGAPGDIRGNAAVISSYIGDFGDDAVAASAGGVA